MVTNIILKPWLTGYTGHERFESKSISQESSSGRTEKRRAFDMRVRRTTSNTSPQCPAENGQSVFSLAKTSPLTHKSIPPSKPTEGCTRGTRPAVIDEIIAGAG